MTVFRKSCTLTAHMFTYTSSELCLAAVEQTQQHFDVQAQKLNLPELQGDLFPTAFSAKTGPVARNVCMLKG